MYSPVVLFRKPSLYNDTSFFEEEAIRNNFDIVYQRADINPNSLVVGRYSVLPYYTELEYDVTAIGSKLINSYGQHRFVANIGSYIPILEELTPQTWSRLEDVPDNIGSVILKGETNSCKQKWNTHMFAKNKKEAIEVYLKLKEVFLLSEQDIYIRKYIDLETYLIGLNEQPITKEFRIFVCDNQIMAMGYYWSNYINDISECPSVQEIPIDFVNEVIRRIDGRIRFYVIDIAKTKSGDWIVIELNDGQQSGLSECDPHILYYNLKKHLTANASSVI